MSWVSSNAKLRRRYGAFSSDTPNDKAASLFDSVFSKQKPSTSQIQPAPLFRNETRIFTQTVDLNAEKNAAHASSSASNKPKTTSAHIDSKLPSSGLEKSDSSEDEDCTNQMDSQCSTTGLNLGISLVHVDSQSGKSSAEDYQESDLAGTSKVQETKSESNARPLKSKGMARSSRIHLGDGANKSSADSKSSTVVDTTNGNSGDADDDEILTPEVKRQRSDEAVTGEYEKTASDLSAKSEKFFALPSKQTKPKYKHRWGSDNEDEDFSAEKHKSRDLHLPTVPHGPEKIRNVKDANVCLESGELVDYKQDMSYILSTLLDKSSSLNLKCLSLISLAKKCSSPGFRKFLRSGGLLEKTLKAVNDAQIPSMSICISVIIYIMARDKACIKYDEATLRMLSVFLKIENPEKSTEYIKCVKLAWEALKLWYTESSSVFEGSMQFDFEENTLSPSSLILEALVYITCCNREDNMLKNEMLGLGVLQFLVSKVDKISLRFLHEKLNDQTILLCLRNLERCFRIIETCTFCSKKNQAYLISHRGGALIQTCGRLLNFCYQKIEKLADPESEIIKNSFNCVKKIAGVLINLSHDNELCSTKLGQMNEFLSLCLSFFTYLTPRYAIEDRRFDNLVLMSSLLVNLVERCNSNRRKLIDANVKFYNRETKEVCEEAALRALAQMFVLHDSAARTVDEELDNDMILEGISDDEGEKNGDDDKNDGRLKRPPAIELTEDEMAETIQKAMNKASCHMEDSVVASYVALIIGCLMQQNEESIAVVKEEMPNGDISGLTAQLQRFLDFMKYMRMRGSSHRSIERIIELLDDLNK
uniref:WAPL domain-containing protein n=1 Tax=Syphacia muris TaxID=451379 RepID=A0A0N5AM87_9BILA